jgi:hypothetical protein
VLKMNVLPHNAPHQLAQVHSAEEGSTDAAEDERRHGDAAETEYGADTRASSMSV